MRVRERRERSLVESLLSIVLGLEAATTFFASLVIFGFGRFDPNWLALVYGGVFLVVLAVTAGAQRWALGVGFGAVLQLALIATGFIEPLMFLVGAGFTALWIYCFFRGRQIDTQKAAWLAAREQEMASETAPASAPTEGDTP